MSKKLRLEIEELAVETFEAGVDLKRAKDKQEGTVLGNDATRPGENCPPYTSLEYTCRFPTAYYDCCAPAWTVGNPECGQMKPITYWCSDGVRAPSTSADPVV